MQDFKNIDIEKLRYDLLSYFGTGMMSGNPMMASLVSRIERADIEELVKLAIDNKFELNKYKK